MLTYWRFSGGESRIFDEEILGSAVTGLFYQQKNVPTGYILKKVCVSETDNAVCTVRICHLTIRATYLMYGNMCPLTRA